MCPLWWESSCKLQEMYSIQGPIKENIPTSPFENTHSSHANQTNTIHSRGVTYAQITKQNSYTPTNIEQIYTNPPHQQTREQEFKI
jgi:hypothetical protein